MLPKSGYPFAMLHLRVDPAAIDVNVHPAKTEIKFSDEQAVYRAIYRSIVTALVEQEKPEDMAKTIEPPSEEKTVAAPGVRNFTLPRPIRPRPQEPLRRCRQHLCLRLRHCLRSTRPFRSRKEFPAGRTESGRFFYQPSCIGLASPRRTYEPPVRSSDSSRLFSEALAQHGQGGGAVDAPVEMPNEEAPKIVFEGDDDVFIPLASSLTASSSLKKDRTYISSTSMRPTNGFATIPSAAASNGCRASSC